MGNFLTRLYAEPSLVGDPAVRRGRAPKLKPCDGRLKYHVPGKTVKRYGQDNSETIDYQFNSAGYRSEEYRHEAAFRLCVIGESHALGIGVPFEQTFGYKLKSLIANALGLQTDDVNLINLAIGGGSADYCVRTIYRQLPKLAVDFVVWIVPPPDRTEFESGGKWFSSFVVGSADVNNLDQLPADVLGFIEYYSSFVGKMNRVKNMLLTQSFLKSQDIEYVMAVEIMPDIGDGTDALDPFLAELDEDRLLRHSFFMQRADFAADDKHAGPRTHAALAIQLFHHFGCLLRSRGFADLADAAETEALRLMTEDDDFRHCTKFA